VSFLFPFGVPELQSFDEVARKTYANECKRAVTSGILETAESTFLLLIAVRYFNAGATSKALIAAAGYFGFLLSPFMAHFVGRLKTRASVALAWTYTVSAAAFLLAAVLPWQWVFVIAPIIAISIRNGSIPISTHIYQENYPEGSRGKLYSTANMIRILTAGIFAAVAGTALSGRIEYYPLLICVFSLCFLVSAILFRRLPSTPLREKEAGDIFSGFRYLRSDLTFRLTVVSWMFMGFGNLMTVPLRVEYLASERYSLQLSEAGVALFVGIIPTFTRFLLSPIWGRLFDRMDFFSLRIIVNASFLVGILAFFLSESMYGLAFGSFCYGIAGAGGDIAWTLWVTKIAPSDKVPEYMSVHTFFTGLRGVISPIVAFQLITVYSLSAVATLSALLIVVASFFLLPDLIAVRKKAKLAYLVVPPE